MATPPSNKTVATGLHQPKNAKVTTVIQEDPELWRDIQANVLKMDDLYDATFYSWLRSEDNVLVTASYLQRLAGEYDLDRIEHALCWLVNGWRLESIAILVKQVTFDWAITKGDQGEMNRARLVLALTDNWAIQYIARLACTLLTDASVPSPPPPLLKFVPCHARVASLPGSPMASPRQSSYAAMFGAASTSEGHGFGSSPMDMISGSSTLTSSARTMALSTPSSPSSTTSSMSPSISTFSTQLPTHGRRMAVSRRHAPLMAANSTDDASTHEGRLSSTAGTLSPVLLASVSQRSGHHRQSSSTLPGPGQHNRTLDTTLQAPTTTSSFHITSTPLSISATSPAYSSQPYGSYHPHQCAATHHHHHQPQPQFSQTHHSDHQHQQQQQQQHQQQHQQQQQHHQHFRGLIHHSRTSGAHSHVRQHSQPGTVSTSKQHWLQQQSPYSSNPIFYMNKVVFMEELSKKWSFCRLSEFFQYMDPASGISHRFKCKLLKESAFKEELNQKQKLVGSAKTVTSDVRQQQRPQTQEWHDSQESIGGDGLASTTESIIPSPPSSASHPAIESTLSEDVDMVELNPVDNSNSIGGVTSTSCPSLTLLSSTTTDGNHSTDDAHALHPLEAGMDAAMVTEVHSDSMRIPTVNFPQQPQQQEQNQYHSMQSSYTHTDYSDDMNSGLSRGCKSSDENHQHCRAQTVEAIMTSALNTVGSRLSSSSSSSSSTSSTSASSASASLSTLTLTESGLEPATRPLSQPQQQRPRSPFTSTYSSQMLYRHAPTLPATVSTSAVHSSTSQIASSSSSSSSSNPLNIHGNASGNGGQRHGHDSSTSAKRKNSLGVSLTPPSHCSSFSSASSSSPGVHASSDSSLSSSSAIFPGARRTSTSTSTTNEDLKRLRCSRQNSTSSTSGI